MQANLQKEVNPVFVPKPEYVGLYATLDQALVDAQDPNLMPYENQAATSLVNSIKSQIALLGDTGEFVYPK